MHLGARKSRLIKITESFLFQTKMLLSFLSWQTLKCNARYRVFSKRTKGNLILKADHCIEDVDRLFAHYVHLFQQNGQWDRNLNPSSAVLYVPTVSSKIKAAPDNTHFARGIITEWPTSYLTGFDSTKQIVQLNPKRMIWMSTIGTVEYLKGC